MKKIEQQSPQNDNVIETRKPQKESQSAEMKKERKKWLMAAFSAINLSGCGTLNEVLPSLGIHDWKPLDTSKLEQSEITKTPQFKEIDRTLRSAGYTDKQIEKFQSEYAHGCAYGETGGKKILSPVFSSQMIEGEMRLYAEPPTKIFEAGYATPETFDKLLKEEAQELTIRVGYQVKIVSTPGEANQIIREVSDIDGEDGADIEVSGKAEDSGATAQYIEGIGRVFLNTLSTHALAILRFCIDPKRLMYHLQIINNGFLTKHSNKQLNMKFFTIKG